jgi:RNA polymerase sigma factor (sigma-70 family)
MASAELRAALRQLGRLFSDGTAAGLSDAQLLERFVSRHDEEAFAALVAEHGQMVLAVCRRLLNDPCDVEDAFQATFLVLVRKARSVRAEQSLGGWLHRVAHRVAVEANRNAARRKRREERAANMSASDRDTSPDADDFRPALHEELARLPERFRRPVVLCYLEGKTQAEAAAALRWSSATLRRRLAAARERLRARLVHRGIAPSAGLVMASLAEEARAAVPPDWIATTVRTASALAQRRAAASTALVLTEYALRSLRMAQFKTVATSVLTVAAIVGIAAIGLIAAVAAEADAPPTNRPTAEAKPAPIPQSVIAPADDAGPLGYAGVVFDNMGEPLAGATIYVCYPTADQWACVRGATTGIDGRFRFEVARAAFDKSRQDNPWMHASVCATADGYGPVWVSAATPPMAGTQRADRLILRLAKDDVPIEGRIVDSAGRPVSGVRIQAVNLNYHLNRDFVPIPWDSDEPGPGTMSDSPGLKQLIAAVTTDSGGRFTLRGMGRDRSVRIAISGPNIATESLLVETRTGPKRLIDGDGPIVNGKSPRRRYFYGAKFEHVAAATRPIVGVVRERQSGRPIAGANISSLASTDARGQFRLEGCPVDDSYKFRVWVNGAQPYFPADVTVTANGTSLEPVKADFELTRGVLVRGRVTDGVTGQPIRAVLEYIPLKGNRHLDMLRFSNRLRTGGGADQNGRFGFAVPPGPGLIVVLAGTPGNVSYPPVRAVAVADRATGIARHGDDLLTDTAARPIDLVNYNAYRVIDIAEQGVDALDCDFIIDPGTTRGGPIVDPDGKPLDQVMVYGLVDPVFDAWGQVVNRAFAARALEPDHPRRVFFYHAERNLGGHRDVRSDATEPITARLRPCGTIAGRLIDRAGAPVAGARVRLVFEDGQGIPRITFPTGGRILTPAELKRAEFANRFGAPPGHTQTETTDAQGRFRIENVIPSTKFHLITMTPRSDGKRGGNPPKAEAEYTIASTTILPGYVLNLGDVPLDRGATPH